jgi:hypothetical protein
MQGIYRDESKYYYGVQINKREMGGASSTRGRDEKFIQNFGRKT